MRSFKFERVAPPREFLSAPLWRYTTESAFPSTHEIGAELELEGFGAEMMGVFAGQAKGLWVSHNDPSLRGDATELVLRRPVTYEEFINKALPEFTSLKKQSNFKPNLSNRCSVHIHLDFAHKSIYSLSKFLTLYALLEDFFFRACGPERRGNHFCISLRENARFSEMFVKAMEQQNFRVFSNENFRYMALNINSLWKFGSVEIRLHEGTAEEERIKLWVTALKELLDFSTAFNLTPDEIIQQSSVHGLSGFIQQTLPTVWKLIKDVYYDSWEHTDTAQDFAYGVSWANAPKEASVQPPKSKRGRQGQPEMAGFGVDLQANVLNILDDAPGDRHVADIERAKAAWNEMRNVKLQIKPARRKLILDEEGPF